MNKLLNLEEKNLQLKIRRKVIKFASTIPEELRQFCNKFQKKDIKEINEFKQKIDDDNTLKEFLHRSEIIYKFNFIESDSMYNEIIFKLFKPDRIYKNNAKIISENTGLHCMLIIYIVINYINDNFPVRFRKSFSKEEKNLIKYLLFRGNEESYMKKYNISKNELNINIKSICDNLKCKDINQSLNIILIEKYFRKENSEFFNKINELKAI